MMRMELKRWSLRGFSRQDDTKLRNASPRHCRQSVAAVVVLMVGSILTHGCGDVPYEPKDPASSLFTLEGELKGFHEVEIEGPVYVALIWSGPVIPTSDGADYVTSRGAVVAQTAELTSFAFPNKFRLEVRSPPPQQVMTPWRAYGEQLVNALQQQHICTEISPAEAEALGCPAFPRPEDRRAERAALGAWLEAWSSTMRDAEGSFASAFLAVFEDRDGDGQLTLPTLQTAELPDKVLAFSDFHRFMLYHEGNVPPFLQGEVPPFFMEDVTPLELEFAKTPSLRLFQDLPYRSDAVRPGFSIMRVNAQRKQLQRDLNDTRKDIEAVCWERYFGPVILKSDPRASLSDADDLHAQYRNCVREKLREVSYAELFKQQAAIPEWEAGASDQLVQISNFLDEDDSSGRSSRAPLRVLCPPQSLDSATLGTPDSMLIPRPNVSPNRLSMPWPPAMTSPEVIDRGIQSVTEQSPMPSWLSPGDLGGPYAREGRLTCFSYERLSFVRLLEGPDVPLCKPQKEIVRLRLADATKPPPWWPCSSN